MLDNTNTPYESIVSLGDLIPVVSDIDPEKIWMSQNKKGGRKLDI